MICIPKEDNTKQVTVKFIDLYPSGGQYKTSDCEIY